MVFAELQGEQVGAIKMNHTYLLNFIPYFAQHTLTGTVKAAPLNKTLQEPEERPSSWHAASWLCKHSQSCAVGEQSHHSRVVLSQGKFSKAVLKRILFGFSFSNQLNPWQQSETSDCFKWQDSKQQTSI